MQDEKKPPLPVALEQRTEATDQRMFSPSAARNVEPIRKQLEALLPARGVVLEIGCGTGEHAVSLAAAMPGLTWLPSDPDAASRASTASWVAFTGLENVLPPRDVDASAATWGVEALAPFDAMVSINMIHIAPWAAALGLFAGAGRLLRAGGLLLLYGPFLHDGVYNAPSNAAFDESLRARNPSWGLRDTAELKVLAASAGLALRHSIAMPANNTLLVFAREA